jgi:hypothetical protein
MVVFGEIPMKQSSFEPDFKCYFQTNPQSGNEKNAGHICPAWKFHSLYLA